jgi:hypothetical protein
MASHDDELMPENTSGYKISQPKQSLADYQKMGMSTTFWFFVAGGSSCARQSPSSAL